jgi:nucleotide-binding universal stress UspA family protein
LAPAIARARELDVAVKPLSFVSPDPADDICRVAAVREADLVLLGWHKPVLSRSVLGGIVHPVMRDADATVAVFVDRGLDRPRRVLVPFQGSPHDRAALGLALQLCTVAGAAVEVLQVIPPGGTASDALRASLPARDRARLEVRTVEHASPADAAVARGADGFDLIVVGVGREWGIAGRFGGPPEILIRGSRASLLMVKSAELAVAKLN